MSALALITERIRARGPLTVAEFMSIALYHPEHGYYARAVRRAGRHGDFITSVDVGPLFGALLARQFAEMWRVVQRLEPDSTVPGPGARRPRPDFDLVEAGASNGQLARDILDAASTQDPEFYEAIRLHLVDASQASRAAQPTTLGVHAGRLATSGPRMPDAIHGVVYSNELLDALPVHSVVMTDAGLREWYVDLRDRHRDGDRIRPDLSPGEATPLDGARSALVERIGPLSNPAIARHLESLGAELEPGWRAEINLSALAWMTRACLSLHQGFIALVDYGHEARELYSATHAAGTLTSFVQHVSEQRRGHATPPWLQDPGNRDITSHVDLTTVRRVAEDLGCHTLGVLDQTYFLLALMETDPHMRDGDSDPKRMRALKTLIMPGGLGSTMKVMVFGKRVGSPRLQGLSGTMRLT